MKKRILSILLVLILTFAMPFTVFASSEVNSFTISGVTMTPASFKNNFSGNPNSRVTTLSTNAQSAVEILVSNVVVSDGNVTCTFTLSIEGNSIILPISGQLCSSYKIANGVNSAIVVVPETVNGYEVLLFEICNDTVNNNLLVSDLGNTPHIKIYLQNTAGNIYLFESLMPNCFENINAVDYPKADRYKDALWAIRLVDHTTKELPVDDKTLQRIENNTSSNTRGLNYWSTWTGTTYYDSYYLGLDYIQS